METNLWTSVRVYVCVKLIILIYLSVFVRIKCLCYVVLLLLVCQGKYPVGMVSCGSLGFVMYLNVNDL